MKGGSGRHAARVAAGILVTRVLGFVRERVFAHYFGNGAAADAFSAALRIPNALRTLLGEGTLSASFIPVYAALNAFGNAIVFAQAIEMAKTTEPKALIKALETGSFKGWSMVPVTFPQAEGSLWHNWSPPLMILKYTKEGQTQSDAEVAYTLGEN